MGLGNLEIPTPIIIQKQTTTKDIHIQQKAWNQEGREQSYEVVEPW